jgi:hypothetical protein
MRRVIFAVALLFTLPAAAQTPTAEQRAACGDDVKKLCAGVQPGGGRIIDCLSKQKDKVSEACKKAMGSQLK